MTRQLRSDRKYRNQDYRDYVRVVTQTQKYNAMTGWQGLGTNYKHRGYNQNNGAWTAGRKCFTQLTVSGR